MDSYWLFGWKRSKSSEKKQSANMTAEETAPNAQQQINVETIEAASAAAASTRGEAAAAANAAATKQPNQDEDKSIKREGDKEASSEKAEVKPPVTGSKDDNTTRLDNATTAAIAKANVPANNTTTTTTTIMPPNPANGSTITREAGSTINAASPASAAATQPSGPLANIPPVATSSTTKPPPVAKKRKLNKPLPVTQLLSDHPVIQKTVHNLLGLLQTYGPLTVGQLEYNLPPIVGERVNSQSIHDIVQVLVCMGLVQRVVAEDTAGPHKPAGATTPPRYCVNRGVPRADVVLPHQVLDQIAAAHEEITRCAERRQRLKQALQSNKGSIKELLKEMATEYPEIMQDPVYVTALKSMHLDVTTMERERRLPRQSQQGTQSAPAATTTTTTSATKSQPEAASTAQPVTSTPPNASLG